MKIKEIIPNFKFFIINNKKATIGAIIAIIVTISGIIATVNYEAELNEEDD